MSVRRLLSPHLIRVLASGWEASAAGPALNSRMPALATPQLLSLHGYFAAMQASRGFSACPAPYQAEPAAAFPPEDLPAPPVPPQMFTRLEQRLAGFFRPARRRVFAVVEVGSTQYKVTPDDVIITEKLAGVDVNDTLRLGRVLVLGSAAETIIGRPFVPGASVTAAVEEQFLDGKVLIFHKRRRKHSRRTRGHRQPLTALRILSVEGVEEAAQEGEDQQEGSTQEAPAL